MVKGDEWIDGQTDELWPSNKRNGTEDSPHP